MKSSRCPWPRGARGAAILLLILARPAAAAPVRVACVGEHTVHSDKLQRSQEWPRMLGEKLGAAYDVQNFGDCCASVLLDYPVQHANHPYIKPYDRPAYKPGFHESVAFMPDVVIIGPWGKHDWEMADILYKGVLPADKFLADYDTLVRTYLDLPGKPKVFLSLPIPFPMGTAKPGLIDTILAATQTVAAKYGLPMIDLYNPFLGHAELYKDITHIADGAGQRKIAEVVYAAFTMPAPDAGIADAAGAPDAATAIDVEMAADLAPPPPAPDARAEPQVVPADAAAPAPTPAPPGRSHAGCRYVAGEAHCGTALLLLLALLAHRRRRRPPPDG